MTDNRIQVRIPEGGDLDQWLTNRSERMLSGSVSVQARTELELWHIVIDGELRRLRMPLAWMNCIGDILNSSMLDSTIGTDTGIIWHEAHDAFRLATGISSYGAKWAINEKDLLDWLEKLGPAADHALRDAVSRWWETNQEPTKEGWRAVEVIVIPDEYLLRHYVGAEDRPALSRAAELLKAQQAAEVDQDAS